MIVIPVYSHSILAMIGFMRFFDYDLVGVIHDKSSKGQFTLPIVITVSPNQNHSASDETESQWALFMPTHGNGSLIPCWRAALS